MIRLHEAAVSPARLAPEPPSVSLSCTPSPCIANWQREAFEILQSSDMWPDIYVKVTGGPLIRLPG